MKTLSTKSDLVRWFKRQIWSIEPKTQMPFGLRRALDELFLSYEQWNEANRLGFDAETRSDFLGGMLEVLCDDPGRTVKASSLIPGFIGLVLSEELGGDYHVSFARLLEICSELLPVEQGELHVASKNAAKYLVSDKGFNRRFNTKVRIPLDGNEGFPKVRPPKVIVDPEDENDVRVGEPN